MTACRLCKEIILPTSRPEVGAADADQVAYFDIAAALALHVSRRHPELNAMVGQVAGMLAGYLFTRCAESLPGDEFAVQRDKALAACIEALETFEPVVKAPAVVL